MVSALTNAIARSDRRWQCLAVVGLACCLLANGVFDNAVHAFSNADVYGVRIDTNPLTGGLPIIAGCLLVVCACALGLRGALVSAGAAVGLSALGGAGAVLMFAQFGGLLPQAASEVGGVLLGMASVAGLAAWAEVVAARGLSRALPALGLAFLLETGLDLLIENALVDAAAMVLLTLAVLAAPLAALVCFRASRAAGSEGADGPAEAPAAAPACSIPTWLSLACVVCWGVLMGRVQSVGNTVSTSDLMAAVVQNASAFSALICTLLCLALARLGHAGGVTRIAVLALLACSLYFSGVFGTQSIPVGMLTMGTARFASFVYIWLMACDLGARPLAGGRLGPGAAVAAGWGLFTASNTLSTRLGLVIQVETPAFMAYNVLIMAFLVALIVVEFLPRRGGERAEEPAQAAPAPSAEEAFAERCTLLAAQFGLTEREREVLVPLVRGRSAASIAAQLSMSTETARTHIRHIYQKADVHSREELMDLVDAH